MASRSPYKPSEDQALFNQILDPALADDPFAFTMFAFPWGKDGTPLAEIKGPRNWQRDVLEELRDWVRQNRMRMANGLPPKPYQGSTVSGRGPGKSALLGMISHWMRSTQLGSSTIVTANTEAQLVSRTFAEIGKWNTLAINSHWFDVTAKSITPAGWFDALLRTQLKIDTTYYYTLAQLWDEDNPDAFAGVHNHNGLLVLFDEASGIPTPIWTVTDGFFTDLVLHRYWLAFSNGRRNTGAFFETHHKHRDLWHTRQIDSRTVEGIDQSVYQKIIDQYGEDSDEARIEVYGQFPRQGDNQFISGEIVTGAMTRLLEEDATDTGAALVMGVDVARFGDDHSVVFFRQGRDARSIPYRRYHGLDTVQLAAQVAGMADQYKPDAIFVDGSGVGGGVADQLKAMRYPVFDVQVGERADDPQKYAAKREEIWGEMREWLRTGVIADDQMLRDDLLGPEFSYTLNGHIRLESKENMKKRGLASPDVADALALTFARPIARRDMRHRQRQRFNRARGMDYPLFG